ncbi:MAG: hypothetical protein O3C10_13855 [Chloroflexi bacterium]|nr:hypothetical protein [Chloroflexota bacterium]
MLHTRSMKRLVIQVTGVMLLAVAVVAVACSSGDVSQEDFDAVQADLDARAAELAASQADAQTKAAALAALQTQVDNTAPVTIVQTGQLLPPVAGMAPSGWDTDESIRGGLHLLAEYDSSGPDAWSAAEHPLVYFSSEGTESSSITYDENAPYFAGFHIVDAYSKNVIGSFKVEETIDPVTSFPHGTGISPDGKWAYVGWRQTPEDGGDPYGVLAVVNIRTLKIDKLLKQESYFEGGMRSQSLHHIQSWTDDDGNDRVIVQWGFGANGGPHHILDPNNDNKVVKAITYDDVKPMGHPFTTPDPTGQYVYVSIGSNWIREAHAEVAGIAKLDVKTGESEIIEGVGAHPIGITHTQDGKFTYVVDGHGSFVFKIDNELNEVVGKTSAGVGGPYGIALNWDETEIWTVGKGEGSHNVGSVLGMIDATTFRPSRAFNQPLDLGGSASSVDHAILHPDPDVNELWVSNMNGWETIVVNLDTYESTDWIATPNGGNTHSGAFVSYNPDWTGQLESDMGGPKSQEMQDAVASRVAQAAALR